MITILAIETSCDETAAAVISDGRVIKSNVVASQIDLHAQYGGVFPEVASRAHAEAISAVVGQAMTEAGIVLRRPGRARSDAGTGSGRLIAGGHQLRQGPGAGDWLAAAGHQPLGGAYLLALADAGLRRTGDSALLALIASGGHSELVVMRDHGLYRAHRWHD